MENGWILGNIYITDGAGNVTDTYIYDAFGNLRDRIGITVNHYLYTGEQYDPNFCFYYLRARHYVPETGRFATTDPFEGHPGKPVTLHRYLYANGNPVMFVDPGGEYAFSLASVIMLQELQIIGQEIEHKRPRYFKQPVYELYISGSRVNSGYNDFRAVLRRNNANVPGYSFIVGRDTASGHTPYMGRARISERIRSRNVTTFGEYQSNILRGNNCAIHSGRNTHRHITLGCIRMDDSDFRRLFDYLENTLQLSTDRWRWFERVYVDAQPVQTPPDPAKRVPSTGNQQ